ASACPPVNLAYSSWIIPRHLPASFDKPGNIPAHGCFAQFVSAKTELPVHTVGPPGNPAAALLAAGAGVAGQLLQLDQRIPTIFLGSCRIVDDGFQLGTLGGIFGHQLGTLQLTLDH